MTTVVLTTWNGRISPVLDVARQAERFTTDSGRIVSHQTDLLPGTDLQDQIAALVALQPQVLICGAISRPLAQHLTAAGVKLIPFTAGETEAIMKAWLRGALPNETMLMPGCYGRRLGWCRGGRGRNGWGRRGVPR
jgi:predicted Fe-Mo cluster-binding NifX family protein